MNFRIEAESEEINVVVDKADVDIITFTALKIRGEYYYFSELEIIGKSLFVDSRKFIMNLTNDEINNFMEMKKELDDKKEQMSKNLFRIHMGPAYDVFTEDASIHNLVYKNLSLVVGPTFFIVWVYYMFSFWNSE